MALLLASLVAYMRTYTAGGWRRAGWLLAAAADPPKASGSPKRSGSTGDVLTAAGGAPVLRIDGRKRKEVTLTLLLAGGASRSEAETALRSVLDSYWPASSNT